MKTIKNVNSPRDAVDIARGMLLDKYREHFIGLYLSTRNKVNKAEIVSIGTLNANLVHPREVFRPAFISHSNSFIALHNHPSGSCEPSSADIEITNRLKKAGEILGITLIDHVIFESTGKYYSFNDANTIK